jgi:hypothetical protein
VKRAVVAAALALAACSPQAPTPAADVNAHDPGNARRYVCNLTYFTPTGIVGAEPRAVVTMDVDASPAAGGWRVESVAVEGAPGIGLDDPWAPLVPGASHSFAGRDGSVITLVIANGAPITFNALSGAIDWRVQGALGEAGYRGVCY